MRILLVVPDTNIGGITSSVVNFANELSSRGNEIFFLDMSNENLCRDRLDKNITIGELSGKSKYWNISASSLTKASRFKKLFFAILGTLKKITIKSGLWFNLIFSSYNNFGEYDVAVAFRQCAPCYSFVLNKVKAKKKLGFVHGELKYMGDISSWEKYMEQFDRIAYVSNAVKNGFIQQYPNLKENASVIYNMLDSKKIVLMSEELPPIEFDSECFNIVTVSRITKQKQIDWIIDICTKIKEVTERKIHWYVVGDGYLLNDCKKAANKLSIDDIITFVGELSNPYPLMSNADINVLTSRDEAFGMVVVESMILKKPVVVAEYDALKEIMSNNSCGIIAQQNIESLTDAILKMIRDENNIFTNCKTNLLDYEYTNDLAYEQFLNSIL